VNAVDEARGSTMFHEQIVSEEARPVGPLSAARTNYPKFLMTPPGGFVTLSLIGPLGGAWNLGTIVGPQASVIECRDSPTRHWYDYGMWICE
jgi:hypothetical protein